MGNIVHKISDWLDTITKIAMTLSILLMTIVLAVQIFLRYFLQSGIIWSDELARFLMVALVYLGAASAIRDDSHITVSVFEDWIPSLKKWLGPIQKTVMVIYSVFIIKIGIDTLKVVVNQNSANLGVSMAWAYMIIPLSGILIIIHIMSKIFKRKTVKGDE